MSEEGERAERCETCRFWDRDCRDGVIGSDGSDPSDDISDCRRYPPISLTTVEAGRHFLAGFPATAARNWCGEWKPIALPVVTVEAGVDLISCGICKRQLPSTQAIHTRTSERLLNLCPCCYLAVENIERDLEKKGY